MHVVHHSRLRYIRYSWDPALNVRSRCSLYTVSLGHLHLITHRHLLSISFNTIKMLSKLTLVAACLSIVWAVPTAQPLIQPRQDQQTQSYPDQGTLTSPPNVTQYSRPNPNYNASTLNAIKLAYTQIERMAIIRSLGSPDDYFKFDLTPQGSPTNAGNGLGGLAYLAEVANFPVLMGTGLSVAIG